MADNGRLNERLLAKEAKKDYLARVEAPRKRITTVLASPEAKRLYFRFFDSMQMNTNYISNIARAKLPHQQVEQVEAAMTAGIEQALRELDKALDAAEALCREHGITEFAEYAQDPLSGAISVISSHSRKYLELLVKFDQLMPMLATLEIDGVLSKRDADRSVARYKKQVKRVAYDARQFAGQLRKAADEMARPASQEAGETAAADEPQAREVASDARQPQHEPGAALTADDAAEGDPPTLASEHPDPARQAA